MLKFSSNPRDNRYWSVCDDLYFKSEELISQEKTTKNYLGRPQEIAAYNYQYEFINKFASVNNVRKDVATSLEVESKNYRDYGIEIMDEFGIEFKTN